MSVASGTRRDGGNLASIGVRRGCGRRIPSEGVTKDSSIWNRALGAAVLCFVAGPAFGGQAGGATVRVWSGVVINNNCTVDEAFAEAAKCTEQDVPGGDTRLV
jgi:hypothetical protein